MQTVVQRILEVRFRFVSTGCLVQALHEATPLLLEHPLAAVQDGGDRVPGFATFDRVTTVGMLRVPDDRMLADFFGQRQPLFRTAERSIRHEPLAPIVRGLQRHRYCFSTPQTQL
uniref:(northern house mosquito) hypothetical protein n=1 Tax=Culex pipiens TaxID=7175 RepID=A0A8D8A6G9_CULPI